MLNTVFCIMFVPIKGAKKAMDKSNQKRNSYNTQVVNHLSGKHGFTKRFIRQCLGGERLSLTAHTICKEYKELTKKVLEALN